MSKKLQGNGIWESSRMMLPQHKERINEHRTALQKVVKPTLHTDEIEIINQHIALSLSNRELIKVRIFGEYEDREIIGVVKSVVQISLKFKVEIEDGYEWIDFDEVVSIELLEMEQKINFRGEKMQIPTEEEHELITKHLIMPFILDVLQENIKKTSDSQLRLGELFILHMETLMDKVSQEHAVIRQELRKRGIKIIDQEHNREELRVDYMCRGYKGRKVIFMNRIKAEIEMEIAQLLNIDILKIKR